MHRKRGEREREREKKTARIPRVVGIRWVAVSITLHPVTRFPGELFPAIRHAHRAERMNGCSLVRTTLPRRDDGGRVRVDSSFSGLLSSGMRHFSSKNARHVEIRTLS